MAETTGTEPASAGTPARRKAPGPKGAPLLGNFFEVRDNQVRFFMDCWRQYGDIFRFRLGPIDAHVVSHPEHLRQVLVTNRKNYEKGIGYKKTKDLLGEGLLTADDAVWQPQRPLMQPPFTHKSVTGFARDMVETSEALARRWEPFAERAEPLDVHLEMRRLTIAIIGRTMLSMDLEAGGREVEMVKAYGDACDVINDRLQSFMDLPLVVPTPGNLRIRRAVKLLDRLVYELIEERRRTGPKPDLLSKLMDARDERGQGMSARQIRDEVITIFFAGHETSAVSLTWTLYLLSEHPEVEEKLHAELERVLGSRSATAEDIPKLTYTKQVIEESMRLYPPVWAFPRQAIGEDELGGYVIPAGSPVFPCQLLTHRNPAFWPEPERFDPERFAPGLAEKRPNLAYLPFGGGPRTCIGNHFAMMELTLVLATLLRRFRARLVPGHPVEPTSVITLHPKYGMPMRLQPR